MESIREKRLRWAEALESGKFKQCKNRLKYPLSDGTYAYCCLGVACEIGVMVSGGNEVYPIDSDRLEYTHDEILDFVRMNDTHGKSFTEIAAFIRENLGTFPY